MSIPKSKWTLNDIEFMKNVNHEELRKQLN